MNQTYSYKMSLIDLHAKHTAFMATNHKKIYEISAVHKCDENCKIRMLNEYGQTFDELDKYEKENPIPDDLRAKIMNGAGETVQLGNGLMGVVSLDTNIFDQMSEEWCKMHRFTPKEDPKWTAANCWKRREIKPIAADFANFNLDDYDDTEIFLPAGAKTRINLFMSSHNTNFKFKLKSRAFSVRKIMGIIYRQWEKIYRIEDETTTETDWKFELECKKCDFEKFPGDQLVATDTADCSICCEQTAEMRQLSCGHHFHDECVNAWLTTKNTCPICRAPVLKRVCDCNDGFYNKTIHAKIPDREYLKSLNIEGRPATNGKFNLCCDYFDEIKIRGLLFDKSKNVIIVR